jgi:uncharacterized membrane protein
LQIPRRNDTAEQGAFEKSDSIGTTNTPDMRLFWRLAFEAGCVLLLMMMIAHWLGEL